MLTLYSANCIGSPNNCLYPNRVDVTDEASLKAAVRQDYVCAEYRNSYRSGNNFVGANCLPVDCDNDHSDDPADWMHPEDVANTFADVTFVVHYSRNHMRPKNNKAARPKFHVLFPIDPVRSAEQYSAMKKRVRSIFPFFDTKALDAARFFFGTPDPQVEIHEGFMSLTDFLGGEDFDAGMEHQSRVIPEGNRNATLSHFAGRVIKKYGDSEEAYKAFLEEAERCEPPLDEQELSTIWRSAQRFYERVQQQEGYVPPEEYNRSYSLRPADYSDIGQAKVLASEYAGDMVYTDATDYMFYDGTRWVESKQLAVGACEQFLDLQLAEATAAVAAAKNALQDAGIDKSLIAAGGKALEKAITDADREKAYADYCAAKAYRTFVLKRRDMRYVTSALQAAKPMLLRNIQDFDAQEFLLNTPLATYDLRRGLMGGKDHSAGDMITKITSAPPDNNNADIWHDAVESFFCGDKDLINYVQQIVGLAAIGKVYTEALIIAYGDGRNGKSTFWNAIARIMGSYSGTISADALTVGCKRNIKPEMAELKGKRLVIASELEEGMRLNTSVVKQLCSTDEISAEKKYKDPFKYTPTHTLVLYTNHLPRVGASDDGTWRRLIVIPFNAKIEGKSDIKNYADYLVTKAGGAIMSWIIEGAKKAIDNNFKLKLPQCVEAAINRYRANNDWLSIFIDACCEVGAAYTQKSGEFYQEYRAYCARTGEYARSTADFYAGLETAGFEKRKTKVGIIITGLRLKPDFI